MVSSVFSRTTCRHSSVFQAWSAVQVFTQASGTYRVRDGICSKLYQTCESHFPLHHACTRLLTGRARTNGRSTDNVRSKMGFVRSNVWMTGHFVRSFYASKEKINSELFVQLNKVGNYWRS